MIAFDKYWWVLNEPGSLHGASRRLLCDGDGSPGTFFVGCLEFHGTKNERANGFLHSSRGDIYNPGWTLSSLLSLS